MDVVKIVRPSRAAAERDIRARAEILVTVSAVASIAIL
jgi:hypothetical protein